MDTIVALSTGTVHGAIAIVRLSGPHSIQLACSLFRRAGGGSLSPPHPRSRYAYFGTLYDSETPLDEVVLTCYVAPSSYTGEQMAEIATHGSPYVVGRLIELLIERGARPAAPGEFTQRAFLAGKLDLAQAEAVGDLLSAVTAVQHRAAFSQLKGDVSRIVREMRERLLVLASLVELEIDFGEEEVEFANRSELRTMAVQIAGEVGELASSFKGGDALRHGIPITIAGPPNVGKSTLLNRLLDEERAIVTPYAGTTRDTLVGERTFRGVCYRFTDTAGVRTTDDPVEAIGIARTVAQLAHSPASILMLDISSPHTSILTQLGEMRQLLHPESDSMILLSKVDLLAESARTDALCALQRDVPDGRFVFWSAKTDEGFDQLENWLHEQACRLLPPEHGVTITNARHYKALEAAKEELDELLLAIDQRLSPDLLAFHVRAVGRYLGSITGEIGVEEILGNIFQNFCIGK